MLQISVYYPGRRSTFARNDFQLRRAMAIFQGLGGGIDTKGGLIFGKKLKLGNIKGLSHYMHKQRLEQLRREKVQKRAKNHMMIVQL